MDKNFVVASKEGSSYSDDAEPTHCNMCKWDLVVPYIEGRKMDRVCRYKQLKRGVYLVEVWDTYHPLRPGRYGNQRSVLRARYQLKVFKNGPIKNLKPIGRCEQYYWKGGLRHLKVFSEDGTTLKDVTLDSKGRLKTYTDSTRGEFNQRIVSYSYDEDKRILRRWRGRYEDWRAEGGGWNIPNECIVRRNENGMPLLDNGDFTETAYSGTKASPYKTRDIKYVAGRKHGVERTYNKFGRVILEEFFHHGTELPRWMAIKPEDVTVNEILDEGNAEVRRAILELQGYEVFLARCEAAGQLRVVDQDPDDKVGTLIHIDLPKLVGAARSSDTNRVSLLRVKDGTLPKHYVLRVPPHMKTARQANAWTWGLKENQYTPAIER